MTVAFYISWQNDPDYSKKKQFFLFIPKELFSLPDVRSTGYGILVGSLMVDAGL